MVNGFFERTRMIYEIVILAMIAAFLGLRLYSVLGRRAEHEEEPVPTRFEQPEGGAAPARPSSQAAPQPLQQPFRQREIGLYPPALEQGLRAIGALAVILMVTIQHQINEVITGLVGVVLIAGSFWSSVRRNRALAEALIETRSAPYTLVATCVIFSSRGRSAGNKGFTASGLDEAAAATTQSASSVMPAPPRAYPSDSAASEPSDRQYARTRSRSSSESPGNRLSATTVGTPQRRRFSMCRCRFGNPFSTGPLPSVDPP